MATPQEPGGGAGGGPGAAAAGARSHAALRPLPAGEDPDTLVRRQGSEAMRGILTLGRVAGRRTIRPDSGGRWRGKPEQRAALLTRLEAAANRIPDRTLPANIAMRCGRGSTQHDVAPGRVSKGTPVRSPPRPRLAPGGATH